MFKSMARALLELLPFSARNRLRSFYRSMVSERVISKWVEQGRPPPPPHCFKQRVIEEIQKKHRYNVLVETGTYLGDMVEAQRKNFRRIYSVELGVELWKNAARRFRKYPHIEIVQGDSGKVLDKITAQLEEPAIFWLDGHYSAGVTAIGDTECPIYGEIDAIFRGQNFKHIVLVDDARCFDGRGDYPSIGELTKYIESKDPSYLVEVKDDIVRYVPRDSTTIPPQT